MGDRCFNCGGLATDQYTLVLDSGDVLEDNPLCDRCLQFFESSYTIEVVESPVLMRGGEDDEGE